MASMTKHPTWLPKDQTDVQPSQKQSTLLDQVSTGEGGFVTEPVTSNGPKKKVGGRPRKVIPNQLVLDLSYEGLSTREIAGELRQRGYESVSYQTVARVIAKKR